MTRYTQLTLATAFLAILAAPVYAGETVVTLPVAPTAPAVKAVETPAMKNTVVATATGAVDDKAVPPAETKSGSDHVKPEDDKKVETEKKEKIEDKTELKHHKDDKKIEHAVPETGKH